MSHDYDAMVDRLVGELRPVRRLPRLGLGVTVWLLIALGTLAIAVQTPRPDLATRLTELVFVLQLAGLAAIVGMLGTLALTSAAPDRTPKPRTQILAWTLATFAVAWVAYRPLAPAVALGDFFTLGSQCAWATIELATVPAALLLVAVRRGAPVQPRAGGAFACGAGFVLAYLAMRLRCPLDEGAHLIVWHALPVAIGTLAGAVLGEFWLERWRPRARYSPTP